MAPNNIMRVQVFSLNEVLVRVYLELIIIYCTWFSESMEITFSKSAKRLHSQVFDLIIIIILIIVLFQNE